MNQNLSRHNNTPQTIQKYEKGGADVASTIKKPLMPSITMSPESEPATTTAV